MLIIIIGGLSSIVFDLWGPCFEIGLLIPAYNVINEKAITGEIKLLHVDICKNLMPIKIN